MKKIDWLVIKSFFGPFLATFFVVEFVFIMQFFYVYIDDFIGKGLEWYIILELVAYLSANTVPLALPLATLLASIMTFGNLGERYELMAMKSAGIHLVRFMRGVIISILLLTAGSLAFSNYALPSANLNFYTTLADITHKKPALNIKEDVFYHEIQNYVIKIGHKDDDNRHIYDIYIQDNSNFSKNQSIIVAQSGLMFTTNDQLNLVLRLENGARYEIFSPLNSNNNRRTYVKTYFDTLEKVLDLSDFKMARTNKDLYKGHYVMLNISQLYDFVDSLSEDLVVQSKSIDQVLTQYFYFKKIDNKGRDSLMHPSPDSIFGKPPLTDTLLAADIVDYFDLEAKSDAATRSLSMARNIKARLQSPILPRYRNDLMYKTRAGIELQRKYTLAVACLVLLLIGAPFGAIVRKGGIGLPLVASVLFYILYLVLSKVGESLARKNVLAPDHAMWISTFLMLPIGMYLTYKAMNDSSILQSENYQRLLKKIFKYLGNDKEPK